MHAPCFRTAAAVGLAALVAAGLSCSRSAPDPAGADPRVPELPAGDLPSPAAAADARPAAAAPPPPAPLERPSAPYPVAGAEAAAGAEPARRVEAPPAARRFVVNGVAVPAEDVARLERQYGVRLLDGEYWYDRRSGLWGLQGGPTAGQILPGLEVGGPLAATASGGGTGVFVNGRELHPLDVRTLQQFTPVVPGRYWLDAFGNGGLEGQPATFNLFVLASQRGGGGRNPWIHRSHLTGIGAGGDGSFTYVIGKDFAVSTGD